MNLQLTYILVILLTINATPTPEQSPFLEYSIKSMKFYKDFFSCRNPDFYIQMADIEESKPANQDKIILYHGESYGTWIYQMILKAFLYPEAPDDWLPLRSEVLNENIDKTTLLKLIDLKDTKHDHGKKYIGIGLAVTPNLYSEHWTESAWGSICKNQFIYWHKITGFSDRGTLHHELYAQLKEKLIPKNHWEKFKRQKKLLSYFIQKKRDLDVIKDGAKYKWKLKEYFPETFKQHSKYLKSVFDQKEQKKAKAYEGVALQIIIDKELADQITYSSHPFGFPKDNGKYKYYNLFSSNKVWEGEQLEPYSEVYKNVKNRKDDEQARLALTNDFRRYPSRVRIKSIAGIMENPIDYEIVKSMIREMVKFKTGLKAGEDSEAVQEEKPKKETKPNLFDQLETTLYGFF